MPSERFKLSGDVIKPDFLDWISHRACRLGLTGWVQEDHEQEIVEIFVDGPKDLLDAMELGCSLGPITVWVEHIERIPAADSEVINNGFTIRQHGHCADT